MPKPHKLLQGEFLVMDNTINTYNCINLATARERCIFDKDAIRIASTHSESNLRFAVLPDGLKAYLASDAAPYFRVLDMPTGLWLANPATAPTTKIYSMAVTADGSEIVISVGTAPYLMRYDTATLNLKTAPSVNPGFRAVCFDYSSNGNWLAMAHTSSPYITVYDLPAMTKATIVTALYGSQYSCKFSPDSLKFAICGTTPSIFTLYDTSTWTKITTAAPPGADVAYDLAFSPNGNKIAIGQTLSYGALRIYDIPSNTWTTPTMGTLTNYMSSSGPKRIIWLDNETIALLGTNAPNFPCHIITYSLTSNSVIDVQPISDEACTGFAFIQNGLASRKLAGTVKSAGGTGLARTVRAYHRETGEEMGRAVSAADGTFSMKVYTTDSLIVMSIGEGSEVTEIFDSVVAGPWS